ncbi:MAG: FG-GAP-like repeat-containing protein, partial [Myxococcota bacterium]
MRSLLPLLACLLPGCILENAIHGLPQGPEGPGTDTAGWTPDHDTSDTELPDPDESGDPLPECDDQYWPARDIDQLEECWSEGPEVGSFSPEVLWERQTFATLGGSASCMMQPIVCPLTDDDGDGDADAEDVPDVVIITYAPGVLRAISGEDGAELWGTSGSGTLQITGGAACGDLDGDGSVEIVAATSNGVDTFDRHGNLLWSSTACSGHMDGTSDAPGLADMDHDGSPEVIIGNCILDNEGSVVGQGAHGWGSSSNVGSAGFAVDLDQDGDLEVVAGNAAYDKNGTALWYNGQRDGYPAVGNFDDDAMGEIVVTGDARMRVQDHDGTVLCEAAIPSAAGSYGGPPTVADFDGDGRAEIGVAANSTYTVFESDCSVLWQNVDTTDPSSGNTASSVFDFEGDGVADVVYADEHWVWVFDGRDGSVKMQDPNHSNNTWLEYPTIADINADNSADIAVCNTPGSWGRMTGVSVFQDADQSWRPGRRIWNQHGYSITNIEEDGTIPQFQETNWLSYNSFRSGDLTPVEGYSGPDLVVEVQDVCADECDRGSITVWYTVGNQGYANVSRDVKVQFWGNTAAGVQMIGDTTWTAVIDQGRMSASESLEMHGIPTPLYDIWVT